MIFQLWIFACISTHAMQPSVKGHKGGGYYIEGSCVLYLSRKKSLMHNLLVVSSFPLYYTFWCIEILWLRAQACTEVAAACV